MVVVLAVPKRSEAAIKYVALAATIVTFVATLVALATLFSDDTAGAPLHDRAITTRWIETNRGADRSPTNRRERQDLVVRRAWIPYFNIQYFLGLDGISLSLVVLTGLVSVLACLASWNINKQVKGYFALFLLLVASMMGVFISLDLFLFYVFFEVMLLPMYFLIGVWGGPRREYAAIKFLLYTLFGSVFILVAVLILYFCPGNVPVPGLHGGHSFDIVELTAIATKTGYYSQAIQ